MLYKRKNRLTVMSSGPFQQNAPKEIHFELYNITKPRDGTSKEIMFNSVYTGAIEGREIA